MITLYGIKNCDTVKKACRWLDEHAIVYRFHDFRANGIDKNRLTAWVKQVGWEKVLNRRGMGWRALTDAQRAKVIDAASAIAMLAQPALIKRPVLMDGDAVHIGFAEADYTVLLRK